ncbi:MAG: NAD(+)/NADH kinase [Dehalococcoidia bacterium]
MDFIGILYQSRLEQATALAKTIQSRITDLGTGVWLRSSWEEGLNQKDLPETQLIISVGGDGTLLRVTRQVAGWDVPILGINAGSLGFLTELDGSDAVEHLEDIINGKGWVEQRSMLEASLGGSKWQAMNEVAISRGGAARTIQISVEVDDTRMFAFSGDGLLVATATGSTAYNLAAGGPVLPPTSAYSIIKAVASHPLSQSAIVVEEDSAISVELKGNHAAVLSIDGHVDYPLDTGDKVSIRSSDFKAKFLRLQSKNYFYGALSSILSGQRYHPGLADDRID